jgi:hypothetical protein
MSFVLKQSASYTWPVPLLIPVDGGRREKHSFDAEFKRLPQDRINQIVKLARGMEKGEDDNDIDEFLAAAKEIVIDWAGITDDAGKDVPFSEAALDQLLKIPTIAGQIIRAWFDSMEVAKKPTSPGR